MTTEPPFEGWAILELMGHRTRPGFVREVEIAGGKMLRVDIHGEAKAVVAEFYGTTSIYSLRPVAEDVARDAAKRLGNLRPVRPVEYREREQLPRPRDEPTFSGYANAIDDEDHPDFVPPAFLRDD